MARKAAPKAPQYGRHRSAVESAVKALAVYEEHAALVEHVRGLADVMDAAEGFDDKLAREYRLALKDLMQFGGGGVDELADEVEQLRRASVGDSSHS